MSRPEPDAPADVDVHLLNEPWENLLVVDPATVASVRIDTDFSPASEHLLWLQRCSSLQHVWLTLRAARTEGVVLTSDQLQSLHLAGDLILFVGPRLLPKLHTLELVSRRRQNGLGALLSGTPNLQTLHLANLTSSTMLPPLPKLTTLSLSHVDFPTVDPNKGAAFSFPPTLTHLYINQRSTSTSFPFDYDTLANCNLQVLDLSHARITAAVLYKVCHASKATLKRLRLHTLDDKLDVVALLRGCHWLQTVTLIIRAKKSTDRLDMSCYPHLQMLCVCTVLERPCLEVPVYPWAWSVTHMSLLGPDNGWSAIITRNRQLVATSKWLTLALWNRRLPADQRLPPEVCRLVFRFAG